MTNRDVRRLLWKWGGVLKYCERKQAETEELRTLIAALDDGMRAHPPKDGVPGGSGGNPVEQQNELREQCMQAVQEIQRRCEEEMRFKMVMDEAIDALPHLWREIVYLRYRDGKDWESVADRLNYSEGRLRAMERDACEHLQRNIKKDSRF